MDKKFAILRIKKIKSKGQIGSAGGHNLRSAPVPNANGTRDVQLLAGSKKPVERLNALLNKAKVRPRSNSVLATEFVLTFSPEMNGRIDLNQWKKDNIEFIKNNFPKGAILSATFHNDESTPHIHVLICPLIKKTIKKQIKGHGFIKTECWRLSARDYVNGKKKLSEWQDRYADAMKHHDLERGIKGSKAFHQTIKKFYSKLHSIQKNVELNAGIKLEEHKGKFEENPPLLGKASHWKKAYEETTALLERVLSHSENMRDSSERKQDELTKIKIELRKKTALIERVLGVFDGSETQTVRVLKEAKEKARIESKEKYEKTRDPLLGKALTEGGRPALVVDGSRQLPRASTPKPL